MNRLSKWVVVLAVILIFALVLLLKLFSGHPKHWKLPIGAGKPALAIGDEHGVILASDGGLWTWGESRWGWGVLGLGTNVPSQPCLRRIGLETNWVNVAVGGSATMALKSDGTLWGWGENLYGQLGDGSTAREQAIPVHSAPGADWKQVATSGMHGVALRRDGTLWSWGDNWAGQLGDGSTNISRVPVRVGSSTNWTRVWANLIETVGQQSDGSLWFWGWDYSCSKEGTSVRVPTRISPDTIWVDVEMGDWMVFGIKSDGTLWAWGREAHVYTGAASANADPWPVQVGADRDWCAGASFAQSCPLFLKRDGSLWVLDASGHRGIANVTSFVTGLITNNEVGCVADNDTLGTDPAYGIVKVLQITFQLGGTNRVETFTEKSSVRLGGKGLSLCITHAFYGDPSLLRRPVAALLGDYGSLPAQLRRIQIPKDVVAFCGGRHMAGAALMADGEVWTWGEALGRDTRAFPPLQSLAGFLGRGGINVHWGDPEPVMLTEPTKLENVP